MVSPTSLNEIIIAKILPITYFLNMQIFKQILYQKQTCADFKKKIACYPDIVEYIIGGNEIQAP